MERKGVGKTSFDFQIWAWIVHGPREAINFCVQFVVFVCAWLWLSPEVGFERDPPGPVSETRPAVRGALCSFVEWLGVEKTDFDSQIWLVCVCVRLRPPL